MLAVWREPTWIHLVSTADYLRATEAAIVSPEAQGIYHAGDDRPVTLQDFLDQACDQWGCRRPYRLPAPLFRAAAWLSESFGTLFRTRSPLTRDFITIGRVSYYGDTSRTRRELLPVLCHPTLADGLATL